jgi:hypothetical protein
MKYIFVGPSGYNLPEELFGGWIKRPPCKQTDIMKLVECEDPTHIALVDGLYMSVPAPWHKEILLALEKGIHVYGVSSMGALRAAELDTFGMRGYGYVYSYIKENEPIDDSIVAVVHEGEEARYRPLTFAKIEILSLYTRLQKHDLVNESQANVLIRKLDAVSFEGLSRNRVIADLEEAGVQGAMDILESNFESIKQSDLREFLSHDFDSLLTSKDNFATPRLNTSRTPYIYRQFAIDYDSPNSVGKIDENRLTFQMFTAIHAASLHDLLCTKAHTALLIHALSVGSQGLHCDDSLRKLSRNLSEIGTGSVEINRNGIEVLKPVQAEQAITIVNEALAVERLDNWSDEEFNLFVNLDIHPALTDRIGLCNLTDTTEVKQYVILNMKLSQILHALYSATDQYTCPNSYPSLSALEDFGSASTDVRSLFYSRYIERIKSMSLVFYHGSLIVSSFLQGNEALKDTYYDFMRSDSLEYPYRIYREQSSARSHMSALGKLRDLNQKRILVIRPTMSLGSHFIDFKYLVRFALSYHDL